jgi:toxin FitB
MWRVSSFWSSIPPRFLRSHAEARRPLFREHGETDAPRAAALMQQGQVVDLDTTLALRAAKLGIQRNLPLAGSLLLATSRVFGATLWTQDADFEEILGVQYHRKRRQ